MIKKIKNILKNKKGISTLEFAISFLVFIMMFSFIFDLIIITYKQYRISEQTTQIARQIAKQSGCLDKTPKNFPGGDENYYTTSELYGVMKDRMDMLDIPESEWTVVIKTKDKSQPSQIQDKQFTLTDSHAGFNTNYRDYISVKTTFNYTWGLWSQFVPSIVKGQLVAERGAFSEYNHDLTK